MKVWDIVQPRDNWERGYAKMAYEATGLHQLFTKHIVIDQVYVCMTCGKLNTFWTYLCEPCDAKAQMEEDNYRG